MPVEISQPYKATEPDWLGFIQPFTQPAFEGSPYDIIQRKVQEAWVEADTAEAKHTALSLHQHWNNFSTGLLSPEIRSTLWLAQTWKVLLERLELCSKPLSEEEKAYAYDLFKHYHLM